MTGIEWALCGVILVGILHGLSCLITVRRENKLVKKAYRAVVALLYHKECCHDTAPGTQDFDCRCVDRFNPTEGEEKHCCDCWSHILDLSYQACWNEWELYLWNRKDFKESHDT